MRAEPLLAGLLALAASCGGEAGTVQRLAGDWPLAVELPNEVPLTYSAIVLFTIDTLRADHVSAYGYARRTTPFLEELAARGVLFERAQATISHTAPSHASILTGLPPLVHGVLHNGYRLEPGAIDLAKVLGARGYESAAFVNTEFLTGVAANFGTVGATTERGEAVVDQAVAWLRGPHAAHVFLWVHLFDPHRWKDLAVEVPEGALWKGKTPPDFYDYIAELHGLTEMGPAGVLAQRWETVGGKEVELDDTAEYLRFVDAYDALILYADQQLRRLYEAVQELGLPGPTLWVVTADHGEGLASHGTDGHGAHIYQEQLHVPLVFHASDGSLGPRRAEELVSHLDLYPTLVGLFSGRTETPAGWADGRSLVPLLGARRGDWPERALFAQRKPTGEPLFALQDGRFKLLVNEAQASEFYDLASDPRELHDRSASAGAAAADLREELERRLRLYRAHARDSAEQEIPDAWLEELRGLGYAR